MDRSLGIFLFDDVEVLDFAGPLEVFSVADMFTEGDLSVFTFGEHDGPIEAASPLNVTPDYGFENVPAMDWMLVPGGIGTRSLVENDHVLEWIRERSDSLDRLLSVCTGSLLLGKAGLLDGKRATTHHLAFDELEDVAGGAEILHDVRYVDDGTVATSAGISAGIDLSFHVLTDEYGTELARETAEHMEYDWDGTTS